MKYIYGLLLALATIACTKNEPESLFDSHPDARLQEKMAEYKSVLTDAPFGWQMYYSLGGNVEYMLYELVRFNEDNTVTLFSNESTDLNKPVQSEYVLFAEADIELVFNTFNPNITSYIYPSARSPKGFGGDIEFNFKSINEDRNEVVLEGKVYKGKLVLKKAKENYKDFSKLAQYVNYLAQERTDRYMNVAITAGLDGVSEEKPFLMGLDLSSIARVGDYAFNYKGQFYKGRKMLYFSHSGMGLSSPIMIDGKPVQDFVYNATKKRYEVANSELKGHLVCTNLPQYYVPGMVDEFLDNYALKMKASFGKVNQTYSKMRSVTPHIQRFVLVTDYNQRIPLFDEAGNPVYDEVFNHDYEQGQKLGNGFLFAFEEVDQFYFYFVPMEVEKLNEDRLRFKRGPRSGEICIAKKGDNAEQMASEIRDVKEFNDFISYICNDEGWYITRTIENGQIDWDFYSISNPKEDYFYSRLN